MKPISAYMEAEEVQVESAMTAQKEPPQEPPTPDLLEALKKVISKELRKIEMEFHQLKTEVCKSLETIEKNSDARLTAIEHRIDLLGKDQQNFSKKTENLHVQILEVDKRENRLEKAFELFKDDFKHIEDEMKEVQHLVVNIQQWDNSLRKNNLRLKGLAEGVEGENLKQ